MNRKLREAWALATADRRKATTLGALLVLLAALGIKGMVSAGPKGVRAAAQGDSAPAGAVLVSAGRSAVSRTLASADPGSGGGIIRVRSSPRLERDLFALDEAHFPRPDQTEPSGQARQESQTPAVESPPENADDVRARAESRVTEESRRLRLKSIVIGQAPMAVIEATGPGGRRTVARPGQMVEGFVLIEVSENAVVLEKDSVRVRLWLTVPDR